MDVAESEAFKRFSVSNKALVFLIKFNKTTCNQLVPKISFYIFQLVI